MTEAGPDELHDFFTSPALPCPVIPAAQAAEIARDVWGIGGEIRDLGSQQDRNVRIKNNGQAWVLKLANPAFSRTELDGQNAAMRWLARVAPAIEVPVPVSTPDGHDVVEVSSESGPLLARVLTYVEGIPLSSRRYHSPDVIAELGQLCARASVGLAGFEHPSVHRTLQWDSRHALAVVELLVSLLDDTGARGEGAALVSAARAAGSVLGALDELPTQVVHGDITEDNVIGRARTDGRVHPIGIIDFGDVMLSYRVGDIAATAAMLLRHARRDPLVVLPAIVAFDREVPLTADEIDALWPLVVQRAAVLVASDLHQLTLDEANTYAADALPFDRAIFAAARSIPAPVAAAALRAALGRPRRPSVLPVAQMPMLAGCDTAVPVDLSITSPLLTGGDWLTDGSTVRAARTALGDLPPATVARTAYGVPRLTESSICAPEAGATVPLGIDLFAPIGSIVGSPLPARVLSPVPHLRLDVGNAVLLIGGLERLEGLGRSELVDVQPGDLVPAGGAVGVVGPDGDGRLGHLRAQAVVPDKGGGVPGSTTEYRIDPAGPIPYFVPASQATGWSAVCPDPSALIGVAPADGLDLDGPSRLLDRRDGPNSAVARVQEHYYQRPPEIERGWRHHLFDTEARGYVDLVNNVTILGHAHPAVTAAASQWALLNTNSRFHYSAVVDLCERLAMLAPDGLDQVFLVNSGSEAVDLAIRLARICTGREDVLCVAEAYHGWTLASDAVSTSVADNPRALETRPDWVHTVLAPNSYRGRFRSGEPDSPSDLGAAYADDVRRVLAELDDAGRGPAGFIAEAFFGNAGGVPLPDGYLERVYAMVRERGGLVIADEVQVAYGRLGDHFWGFEQQAVVPDVITVAKATGNGQPIGAVITSRVIAERFRDEGYFFSSTGGSPVSCRIAVAVLDALGEDGLQENARTIGRYFKAGLEELAGRHTIIGAVHGLGLYLGVELVRDRLSKEPATAETAAICDRLLELGVIVQPTGDHLNVLKIKPPLCLDQAAVDFSLRQLDEVLTDGW